MNGTMIGKLGRKNSVSPTPFKDLCESIGIARKQRSEYFRGLIRAWNRKNRLGQGEN